MASSYFQKRWFRFCLGILSLVVGCNGNEAEPQKKPAAHAEPAPAVLHSEANEIEASVTQFCGACHAVPPAASVPKTSWGVEVSRCYYFYFTSATSKSSDSQVAPQDDIVAYFRGKAPDRLEFPKIEQSPLPRDLSFRRQELSISGESEENSGLLATSFLGPVVPADGAQPALLLSDMRGGGVYLGGPVDFGRPLRQIARLTNPAVVHACDLDGNAATDLVVADLGSFTPADHALGRVVWLRDGLGSVSGEPVELLRGVGRVADVQSADFDGDGDLDFVVAEFGARTTGRILLLTNTTTDGSDVPRFEVTTIDERAGTIHVPVIDLNADGRPDFVALISQQHETVVAFLNDADGKFHQETIYDAQDPSYGSSGIQLVDLDQDGDQDVLYTNGDTFDSYAIKPYHGVQWLENRGAFPFVHHHLTSLPGVHRALAADIDGDGDLDIVAAALLPDRLTQESSAVKRDSLILLRQIAPKRFTRHSLEQNSSDHAAMSVQDFDGDGDPDIVVGHFADDHGIAVRAGTIWWNERANAVDR